MYPIQLNMAEHIQLFSLLFCHHYLAVCALDLTEEIDTELGCNTNLMPTFTKTCGRALNKAERHLQL